MSFKEYLNVYEFQTVLPGSGETIKFKPITTGNLKKLLVYENEDNDVVIENALDELISSSVQNEDFDIKNLYLQDRFFLLVELRKRTKGNSYKFSYKCEKCGSQTLQNIDLSKLPLKTLDSELENNIQLTDTISVELKHVTRRDQTEAFSYIKEDKGMSTLQRATEMALFTHAVGIKNIITPDGTEEDVSIEDRKYLLENVSTGAYDAIKEWHVNNDFGVTFMFKIGCANCDNDQEFDIPLDNFFF